MKRLHRIYPLTASADQQTDIRILGGWWFKETAGSTAEVKIQLAPLADPTDAPTGVAEEAVGSLDLDANYKLKYTFVDAAGNETEPSPASANVATATGPPEKSKITWSFPVGPTGTVKRKLYRTEGGGAAYNLLTTINDNTTLTYLDAIGDASLTTAAPTSNDTGTELFDIPLAANQAATLPGADMPIDCGGLVFVESVSGAWTGALIGQ